MCTGAVGALAHYIERAGVATTSISLVREQSEQVAPPRALWVPFPLGRPLGVADDADFQLDVMRAAFGLLDTATEPTIVDYPIEMPDAAIEEPWACPLNLATESDGSLGARLAAEVAGLRPWAHETRRARGRTLFGGSGASPDQVDQVAAALVAVAESGDVYGVPDGDIEWAHPMPLLLRHLAEDLRGFYHEAIAAQPGDRAPDHDALNDWIFGETDGAATDSEHTVSERTESEHTVFGETLLTIGDQLTTAGDDDPMALFVRGFLIPEGRYKGISSFKNIAGGGFHDNGDA